jgi:hypothetical protein
MFFRGRSWKGDQHSAVAPLPRKAQAGSDTRTPRDEHLETNTQRRDEHLERTARNEPLNSGQLRQDGAGVTSPRRARRRSAACHVRTVSGAESLRVLHDPLGNVPWSYSSAIGRVSCRSCRVNSGRKDERDNAPHPRRRSRAGSTSCGLRDRRLRLKRQAPDPDLRSVAQEFGRLHVGSGHAQSVQVVGRALLGGQGTHARGTPADAPGGEGQAWFEVDNTGYAWLRWRARRRGARVPVIILRDA